MDFWLVLVLLLARSLSCRFKAPISFACLRIVSLSSPRADALDSVVVLHIILFEEGNVLGRTSASETDERKEPRTSKVNERRTPIRFRSIRAVDFRLLAALLYALHLPARGGGGKAAGWRSGDTRRHEACWCVTCRICSSSRQSGGD